MCVSIFPPWRWLLGLGMALSGGAVARAAFEIAGELPATFADGTVVIARESLEERDSTPVMTGQLTAGRFRLRVEAEPGLFDLRIGEKEISFVAGEGQTLRAVVADGGDLRVTGGADQALFEAYEAFRSASLARLVLPARAANTAAQAGGNEAEIARLTEAEVSGYRAHRHELNDFTLERLRGSPALYAASLRWDGDYRLEELAAAVREFAAAHPKLEIARLLQERIARFRATAIGAPAPALAGPTPEKTTLALAELRGRYVLVDFWASWCAPCRVENRHYVELRRRYRTADFEILAVSLDQSEPAWRAAIAKDGATWRHISDLAAWKSPLAARYGVTALPASFLVDREGRIVAKDVRGRQLDDVLAAKLGPAAAPAPKR